MKKAPRFAPRGFPTFSGPAFPAEAGGKRGMRSNEVDNSTFLWITVSPVLRGEAARRMLLARRFAGGRATRSSQRIGYDARLVRSPLSGSSTKYDAVMAELIGEDVRRSDSRADRRRGAHVPRRRRVRERA
jgi:hypothetical protein